MSQEIQTVQETALLEVNKLQEIVATAPQILSQNIESKTKAIDAGRRLIDLAKIDMNDVYDTQLQTYISKVKKTAEAMNDRRKPFTQIVDAVKKQFTSLESELKPIVEEAQKLRDEYAYKKMLQRQEEERQAKLRLEKEKEIIEIRKSVEIITGNYFADCTAKTKRDIADFFNALTLDKIEEAATVFATTSALFDSRYSAPAIELDFIPKHVDIQTQFNIVQEAYSAINIDELKGEYTRQIKACLKDYSDKLPSKKSELMAIAEAGVAERKRLEELADLRKKEEEARIEQERNLQAAKKAEEAAISATAEMAGAMVDSAATATTEVNVKEGYSIKVKNNAAYLLMVQFWFEKEGKSLPVDKLEKYTFDRVKRFCEAYAIKNDEMIQSPLLSYEPVYKAK